MRRETDGYQLGKRAESYPLLCLQARANHAPLRAAGAMGWLAHLPRGIVVAGGSGVLALWHGLFGFGVSDGKSLQDAGAPGGLPAVTFCERKLTVQLKLPKKIKAQKAFK